jgi:hypothetical protein
MKAFPYLFLLLALSVASCKKEDDNTNGSAVTCLMDSTTITQNYGTMTYLFERNTDGKIVKATWADGYIDFIYTATTTTINTYGTDGTLKKHSVAILNPNGSFDRSTTTNYTNGIKDTSIYTYNSEGYLIATEGHKNGVEASSQLTYANGNHTQSIYHNYDGTVTTFQYQYSDKLNKTGVHGEFSLLLPPLGKYSKNLMSQRTTIQPSGTFVDTYSYTFNEHGEIITMSVTDFGSPPYNQIISYTCK